MFILISIRGICTPLSTASHTQHYSVIYYYSEWLEDGLTTDSVTKAPDGLSYHVLCSAQHFTSFAVLVDVSDVEVSLYLVGGLCISAH